MSDGEAANADIEAVIAEERRCILATRNELDRLRDPAEPRLDDTEFVGLALSGGGIRSATFNLGVLQALAAERELQRFDYLSTVSGGGYIGAWLTAWIHRRELALRRFAKRHLQSKSAAVAAPASAASAVGGQTPHVRALLSVEQDLAGAVGAEAGQVPRNMEPEAISRLRAFSRYLAPRAGVLSLDTVTLATTWLRNVFLNLLVMLSLLGTLMLAVWLLPQGIQWLGGLSALPLGPLCIALGAVFFGSFALQLYTLDPTRRDALAINERAWYAASWVTRDTGRAFVVVAGLWAAAFDAGKSDHVLASGVIIGAVMGLLSAAIVSWYLQRRLERQLDDHAWQGGKWFEPVIVFVLASVLAIAAVAGCLVAIRHVFAGGGGGTAVDSGRWLMLQLTLAPAFALIAFSACGSLFVGLVGRQYADGSREWWARLNAEFVRGGVWWLIFGGVAFAAAGIADWIGTRAQGWWAALLATGWIGSAIASIFGPRVKVRHDNRKRWLGNALGAAAFVFGTGLVLLAAAGIHRGMQAASALGTPPDRTLQAATVAPPRAKEQIGPYAVSACADDRAAITACIRARAHEIAVMQGLSGGWFLPVSFAVFASIFAVLGWRVDVNRFSLHDLYKLRLVRCYLGASNTKRRANHFTDFDPRDDIRLEDIHRRQRPFHLVNAAVNLSVPTSLAWQQRKASSFTFSNLFCGFVAPRDDRDRLARSRSPMPVRSYVATASYGRARPSPDDPTSSGDADENHVTLGGAIATSGAAISPTAGMNTRPALAFILTLFNLRTGRWLLNPTLQEETRLSPRFGWYWLLQELLANTHAAGAFIHLSDGGHFDNLGVYELVRRRCTTIVCVDASADADRQFDDLGEVVRKCRVDLDVSIELDTRKLVPDPKTGLAEARLVAGHIRYPGQKPGRFFYVKPGLGDGVLLRDLLTHLVREPEFPHVATTDQFFNESQFESYRRLGALIGAELVSELKKARR